jgi:hypothetical protein
MKGRQLCYQDHVVNFRQDITEIATRLPRLPATSDIMVIRKADIDISRHVGFMVRREKVKVVLQYKIRTMQVWSSMMMIWDSFQKMGLSPIVSPLAVRDDKMGVHCQLDRVQLLLVEKVRMNLKMRYVSEAWWKECPEVEQLRRGAAQAITGTRYEQNK